jgi:polar amino acid transport system substrate-binding protein
MDFDTRISLLLRTLAVVAPLAFASLASAETLRIRADNWMPFNGDPEGEQPGYVVEIAKAIFEPQGITVDYQIMTWADALKAARGSEIEAVIGANAKEAEGMILPVSPIGSPRVGLFVRKGSTFKFEHIKSLEAIRLGVIKDYSYWDSLDNYIKASTAPRVITFEGDDALNEVLTQLKQGKIDVYPEVLPVFAWFIKSHHMVRDDFWAVYLHEGEDIFVAFSPSNGAGVKYAKLFDEGIKKLRESGKLGRILGKYGQKDWK